MFQSSSWEQSLFLMSYYHPFFFGELPPWWVSRSCWPQQAHLVVYLVYLEVQDRLNSCFQVWTVRSKFTSLQVNVLWCSLLLLMATLLHLTWTVNYRWDPRSCIFWPIVINNVRFSGVVLRSTDAVRVQIRVPPVWLKPGKLRWRYLSHNYQTFVESTWGINCHDSTPVGVPVSGM